MTNYNIDDWNMTSTGSVSYFCNVHGYGGDTPCPSCNGTGYERLAQRVLNPSFQDTVDEVLFEVGELIVKRQRTYGPTNIDQQGIFGITNRILHDKGARIKNRLNGTIVNGEVQLDEIELGSVDEPGIINDLADVIGYAVCAILKLRGNWGRPLAPEESEND